VLTGHGDDTYKYKDIRINFSSNVYNHFCHDGLYAHLASRMDCIRNYPPPTPSDLEQEIATLNGLSPDEVIVTNGATEAIYLIAQAFANATSQILQPTFTEYEDACRIYGHEIKPLTPTLSPPRGKGVVTFSRDIDSLSAILSNSLAPSGERAGVRGFLTWLCSPNNPTGQMIPKMVLESAIASHPDIIFVIDESYAPFTMEPLVGCNMSGAGNVITLHSMTKEFAIPGLRIGYITGSASLLSRIRKCRMPWSVNQLAIEAAHYLLAHKSDYALDLPALMSERERMARELSAIDGITVYPSDTHILLCRIEGTTAAQLKDYLANNYGILIRDASNFQGLDEHFFRIAVQTKEEDDELIRAIKEQPLPPSPPPLGGRE
jgi:threonine-phosphate decarboxylase